MGPGVQLFALGVSSSSRACELDIITGNGANLAFGVSDFDTFESFAKAMRQVAKDEFNGCIWNGLFLYVKYEHGTSWNEYHNQIHQNQTCAQVVWAESYIITKICNCNLNLYRLEREWVSVIKHQKSNMVMNQEKKIVIDHRLLKGFDQFSTILLIDIEEFFFGNESRLYIGKNHWCSSDRGFLSCSYGHISMIKLSAHDVTWCLQPPIDRIWHGEESRDSHGCTQTMAGYSQVPVEKKWVN